MNPRDEGLGLSLLLYLAALLCGLAVIVLPVYRANRPTVIENANARMLARSANGIPGIHTSHRRFPVARLKDQPIVDPATVTELNAEARKNEQARVAPVHITRRQPRRPPPENSYASARRRPAYPHIHAMF